MTRVWMITKNIGPKGRERCFHGRKSSLRPILGKTNTSFVVRLYAFLVILAAVLTIGSRTGHLTWPTTVSTDMSK